MEKKRNKKIILIEIIFLFGFAFSFTFYKIKKNHDEEAWKVVNLKVMEAALKCKNEEGCLEDTVTLTTLKEKGYLESDILNPITKEYISMDSYVDFKTNTFIKID